MSRVNNLGTYIVLGLLVVIWGVAYPVIKILLGVLTPFELMLVRFWITSLPLLGIAIARRREVIALLRSDPGRILLLALLGVPGYHLTLNFGTHMMMRDPLTTNCAATIAAILVASLPAWTGLFSRIAGQERMTRLQWAGQIVAFIGVIIVVSRGDLSGLRFTSGALLVLGAPLSWALYSVLARPLLTRVSSSMPLVAIAILIGTIAMTPFTPSTMSTHLAALGLERWIWLIFLSLLATFAGYLAWALAIARLGANRTSVSIYFIPLSTLVAGMLLLGEQVGRVEILGGLVILGGVILTGIPRR
ncbi:MAG: DMT family transporter [bacterium]|nr:DMT family transporter [bacterium]